MLLYNKTPMKIAIESGYEKIVGILLKDPRLNDESKRVLFVIF